MESSAINGHDHIHSPQDLIGESKHFDFNQNGLANKNFNMKKDDIPEGWPTLEKEALNGLAGSLIGIIEPHSEADIVGLLLQTLTAFGSIIGRKPHFRAEADCHSLNLFSVLVGETSKGRKGTSWGYVRKIFSEIDPHWAQGRIKSGLSSGEGLIHEVRDSIFKQAMKSGMKTPMDYDSQELQESGVEDKRLLVCESEFASTIGVLKRVGNTLSPLLRQAWDSGDLNTLTKNNPTQATGAHISLVGHITKDEILKHMTDTEALNGFANRILWACVRRSKILPEGGTFGEVNLSHWVEQLRQASNFARDVDEIKRDEEARAIWVEVYEKLSEGKPGLLGGITNRAEAQVMRVACLYALLDCSNTIKGLHLRAALSLWKYCEDSAKYIFDQRIIDPFVVEMLQALEQRPAGMTRTDILNYFNRNKKGNDIQRCLSFLQNRRQAKREIEIKNGKPVERWIATVTNYESTKSCSRY